MNGNGNSSFKILSSDKYSFLHQVAPPTGSKGSPKICLGKFPNTIGVRHLKNMVQKFFRGIEIFVIGFGSQMIPPKYQLMPFLRDQNSYRY